MTRQPNILFSMCDDQRHDCMKCAGHPFIDTPAMDRLAREGIRFANGFTAIPLCAPSRASHLSGVYPHTHRATHNRAPIRPDLVTWPEQLQKAGYRTGFFGKIHYGTEGIDLPGGDPKPGFERWVSFRGQGDYEDPIFIIDGEEVKHQGYNTDLLADYVEQFLDQDDDRPWAICLWYKAPHGPFTPPPRHAHAYSDDELPKPNALGASRDGKARTLRERPYNFEDNERYDTFMRNYVRTVRGVDDALGRILDKIDAIGQTNNTLVVHTSDHGYFHGEFGLGDKRWMYDPSIRVPYLMRYPDLIANPGRVEHTDVISLDIPATIMDVSGLGVPNHYHGHSLRPLLTDEGEISREDLFFEYFEDPPYPYFPTMVCLRTQTEKLIHYIREGEGDEYYDLVNDPHEYTNAIADPAYAHRVADMQKRLSDARKRFAFTVPDLSGRY